MICYAPPEQIKHVLQFFYFEVSIILLKSYQLYFRGTSFNYRHYTYLTASSLYNCNVIQQQHLQTIASKISIKFNQHLSIIIVKVGFPAVFFSLRRKETTEQHIISINNPVVYYNKDRGCSSYNKYF